MRDELRPVEELTDEEIDSEIRELLPQIVVDHQPGVALTPVNGPLERYRQLKEEAARRREPENR